MKVFVVSRGYPTNCYPLNGVFEFDQSKALAKAGHEVALIAVDFRSLRRKRTLGYERKRCDGVELFVANIPLGNVPDALKIRIGRRVTRALAESALLELGNPDVIHAHFALQGAFGLHLKELFNAPLVYTEHCSKVLTNDVRYVSMAKSVCKGSDQVIAVSNVLAEKIKPWCEEPPVVIANVVDDSLFGSLPFEAHDGFEFLSAGSLIPCKGFDVSIRSFARARKVTGADLRYTIVGGGPLANELRSLAENLGVANYVHFAGQLPRAEIARFFSRADCFVMASHHETFGVVCIEAMAAGLPVLATRCGGPDEIVTGFSGILVDPGNIDELSDGMIEMATTRGTWFDKQRIRMETLRKYSPLAIANQLTSLYGSLLNLRQAKGPFADGAGLGSETEV